MTTTGDITRLRLSGLNGLLAAIPALLGFHPRNSLVMVCLTGQGRRVGPVLRVDLSPGIDEPEGLPPPGGGGRSSAAPQLVMHARQHADEVALVCYTDQSDRPTLLDAVLAALATDGTMVLDAVVVRGNSVYPHGAQADAPMAAPPASNSDGSADRHRSLSCFPAPADDDPQIRATKAAFALQGRAILTDRQAVRDSSAGPVGAAAIQASTALRTAADQVSAVVGATGPVNRRALRRLAEVTVDEALATVAGPAGISEPTRALLALLACDVQIRDQLIGRAVREMDAPWTPMLIAVARSIVDEDAAQICTMLSIAAYRRGDGALAQVAVDRTLSAEPDHRLAHLVLAVMAAGLPPDKLVQLTSSFPAGWDSAP